MNISINKDVLKSQAEVIRAYLKVAGMDLSQSSAYQLLAKLYGFNGWNELSAALKIEDQK
jgi:hypothetical protein